MNFLPHPAGRLATGLALVAGLLSPLASGAAGVTSRFTLDGDVSHAATFDLAALQTLPATTQTVQFMSGSTSQTHTYTGTSVWGLVDAAGVKLDASRKNDVLNHYVLATGSDSYRVVYSLGELNPGFGHVDSLVAYSEVVNGASVPLGADGFARTTAPVDLKGGRYVSNLERLSVGESAAQTVSIGGGRSASFTVSGDVTAEVTFDAAALAALPHESRTVGADTYSGVSLWSLLTETVGIETDPAVKNDLLDFYVVATGSDGYRALFSMGELDPAFGGRPDLDADSVNGEALDTTGFARIVVPDDAKGGRMVSNLIGLEVYRAVAPVPEPATWALVAGGLLVVSAAARRRAKPTPAR